MGFLSRGFIAASMRVAFVSEDAQPDAAGEQAARVGAVAADLAARGHEVVVCCRQWWDGRPKTFEVDDVTYRAVTRSDDGIGFTARLPDVLARLNPDVVHAVHEPPGSVLAARLGGVLTSTPLVVDWYDEAGGDLDEADRAGWTRRRAARSPAAVVTPSRLVRTAVRALGVDADDVRVVPNAVDFDLIRDTPPDESGGEIVYSRALDEGANLESLLLALAEFREYDWRATVIGDGPERPGYERQARDLRIADRVDFVGDLPVEERIALFRNAHVYVQTARYCPFATDLLRGLACGCVGVVEYHANSSAHELVERRDRGLLASGDTEVVDAITEAGSLERMDVNDEFAEFGRREVLEQYLDVYREVQEAYGLL